jgi:hypothetical protein
MQSSLLKSSTTLIHRWEEVLWEVSKETEADKFPKVDDSLFEKDPKMPVQNVILWMYDGISRSYFMHNLPKTWAYLESLLEHTSGRGGFLFRGHNTVALNSYPNWSAFMKGE